MAEQEAIHISKPNAIEEAAARRRTRQQRERVIEGGLFLAALTSVATTVLIIAVLLTESIGFFKTVPLTDFFTDTLWTPLFANPHYGILPLLAGTLVTSALQRLWPDLPGFNMLGPGIVIGIMIMPFVISLSEDAMRAVPMVLREGSYAMGATRLQTAWRVVVPAATSGLVAAYVLGVSRAVGETMVVAIAAGQ
ncbi:MAG: ABC transporter permease subunit, partial [Nitrospira sp.]